ncbi:MAG: hypothetical protein HY816_06145 [Candidatus Wallbacteria bacterium]|nr:hypothetical protein [Candidatus Wallbacteria bacterium]
MLPLQFRRALASLAASALLATAPAAAHIRMLGTENLEMLAEGQYQLELGAVLRGDESFPLSGLTGDYLQLGNISFEKALGKDAFFFVRGTPYQRLSIDRRAAAPNTPNLTFTGNTTDAVGNFTFGTKLRFSRTSAESAGFGFQFAVEMPNTPNETGLGNDETNFFGTFIGEIMAGDTTLFANLGLGILGIPSALSSQSDKILWGVGFVSPISNDLELIGDVSGRSGSENPGTEDRGTAHLGVRSTAGDWQWDVGVLHGIEAADADWGLTAGLTHRWGR